MSGTDELRNFLRRKLIAEITQHFRTRSQNPIEVVVSDEELKNLVDVEIRIVNQGTEPNSNLRYVIIKARGSYEIRVGIRMPQGARARRSSVGGGIAGFFGGGSTGAGIGALIGIIGGPIGVGIGLAIGAGVGAVVGTVSGAVGGGAVGTRLNLQSGSTQCKIRDILPGMGRVMSADNDDYIQVKIVY